MAEAVARGAQLGIPAQTIVFIRDVRGLAPTPTRQGSVSELTDGIIAAVKDGNLVILAVLESKSKSNLIELSHRPGEVLGQVEWDFERFRQIPTVAGGRVYQPSQVRISRNFTKFVGIAPPGRTLSPRSIQSIELGLDFNLEAGAVTDEVLTEVARRMIGLMP